MNARELPLLEVVIRIRFSTQELAPRLEPDGPVVRLPLHSNHRPIGPRFALLMSQLAGATASVVLSAVK